MNYVVLLQSICKTKIVCVSSNFDFIFFLVAVKYHKGQSWSAVNFQSPQLYCGASAVARGSVQVGARFRGSIFYGRIKVFSQLEDHFFPKFRVISKQRSSTYLEAVFFPNLQLVSKLKSSKGGGSFSKGGSVFGRVS